MSVLILDALDKFHDLHGVSEGRAVKEILKLMAVPTSEVIELRDGFDLFSATLNFKNHHSIYLATHAGVEGFQLASGLIFKWSDCGNVLNNYPNIKFLFLSGCEAGNFEVAKIIATTCKHTEYVFGPRDKLTASQALLAAHIIFYKLIIEKHSPEYVAAFAGMLIGLPYYAWSCSGVRMISPLIK